MYIKHKPFNKIFLKKHYTLRRSLFATSRCFDKILIKKEWASFNDKL